MDVDDGKAIPVPFIFASWICAPFLDVSLFTNPYSWEASTMGVFVFRGHNKHSPSSQCELFLHLICRNSERAIQVYLFPELISTKYDACGKCFLLSACLFPPTSDFQILVSSVFLYMLLLILEQVLFFPLVDSVPVFLCFSTLSVPHLF